MWLTRLSEFLRGAWRTLPIETLVVAMAATGAVGLVHGHQVWFLRLFLAGVLLTPLAFAGHRLGQRAQLLASAPATLGVFVGGKEAGRASLADIMAISRTTRVLPSRTVRIVGTGGATIAELAIQRLEVWQAEGAAPEAFRLTGAVLWPH